MILPLLVASSFFYHNLRAPATYAEAYRARFRLMRFMDRVTRVPFQVALTVALLLSQITNAQTLDVSALKGRWVLETVDGKRVSSEGGEVYFQVTEQAVTGYDGCNRFGITLRDAAIRPVQPRVPPRRLMPGLTRATLSRDHRRTNDT